MIKLTYMETIPGSWRLQSELLPYSFDRHQLESDCQLFDSVLAKRLLELEEKDEKLINVHPYVFV